MSNLKLDAIGLYKPNWTDKKATIPMRRESIGDITNIPFSSAADKDKIADKIAEMQEAAKNTTDVQEALLLRFTGEVHNKTGANPLLDELFNMASNENLKGTDLYNKFIELNKKYGIKNVQLPSIEVVNGKTYYTLLIPVEKGANTTNLKGHKTIYFDENGKNCGSFEEAPTSKAAPETAPEAASTETSTSTQPNGNNNNQITHMGLFDPKARQSLPTKDSTPDIDDMNITKAADTIRELQNEALESTDKNEGIWLNLAYERSDKDEDADAKTLFKLATNNSISTNIDTGTDTGTYINTDIDTDTDTLYEAFVLAYKGYLPTYLQLPSKEEVNGREYYTMLIPKKGSDGKRLPNTYLKDNTTIYFNAETGKAAFTWMRPGVDIKNRDAVILELLIADRCRTPYTPEQMAEIADYYMSEDRAWCSLYWGQADLNILHKCIAGMDAQAKAAFKEKHIQRIESEIKNLKNWENYYFNENQYAIKQMEELNGKFKRFCLWLGGHDADKRIESWKRVRDNCWQEWQECLQRGKIAEKILAELQ